MVPSKGKMRLAMIGDSSATSATLSVTHDTRGAAFCMIYVCIESQASTNGQEPSISIAHADATDATEFVTLTANFALANTSDAVAAVAIDMRGKKRYLRTQIIPAVNDTYDNLVGVTILFNDLALGEAPGSTTDMVESTNDVAVVL